MANSEFTAYLAAPGYERQLLDELGPVEAVYERLIVAAGPRRSAAWAQNVWLEPRRIPIASVGEGARALRDIQRNWALYSFDHHRRAALIESKLPHVSKKPLTFPQEAPSAPLGAWTLLDRDTILASPRCSSAFANGEPVFVEDRDGPPNRAYLKLWEALTVLGTKPGPGELCLDLGSSPGGWTWVLQKLGSQVVSVDKAPLDPVIANLPGVQHQLQSAWALRPGAVAGRAVDWMFSDMACYPERLLRFVREWLEAGACSRFVCTLKFQGDTDLAVAREFAAIPGSRLWHLAHNKHELTWALL